MIQKQSKNTYIIYIAFFLLLFIVFGFIFVMQKDKTEKISENVNLNSGDLLSELGEVKKDFNLGNYEESINFYENKGIENLEENEKVVLITNYLAYGNRYYKEKEYSDKAMKLLNDLKKEDYLNYYYKGYSQEIIKNYTGALDFYNKGLNLETNTNIEKSIFLNQIGHVYDLKGEYKKIYSYYDKAYKLDEKNYNAIGNLSRYYIRFGDYDKAYQLLLKLIESPIDNPSKADNYYTLSTLELEMNGLKPNIDKSIAYAKKAVELFKDHPQGYIGIARGYYMKNDKKYDNLIEENLEKAIALNPNSYYVYKIRALYEYDKGNDERKKSFEKAIENVDKDVILMDNQRSGIKNSLVANIIFIGNIDIVEKENFVEFLKTNKDAFYETIKFQLKRKDYGYLSFLKDKEEFVDFIDQEFKK